MKKKSLFTTLFALMACLCLFITACGEDTGPKQLSVPFVSISDTGLASWNAIENASGYTYKIDGGEEKNTTALSVSLADGQSIQVKAVGNGTDYSDSAYSSSQTYSAVNGGSPDTLAVPTVTVSSNGVASWPAVANAVSYKYKIDGGEEKNTTALSVSLADGQSIQVKAVGDGTSYKDSEYSAPKTYTAGTAQGEPPAYLGILASATEPQQTNGVPESIAPVALISACSMYGSPYRSFNDALLEYYESGENHLGSTLPEESNYPVYSRAGETVYIQIWLNNPRQYSIISLKLNGTKYQVGGGLSSFFVNKNGVYYNCLYVAVTVPADTYVEKEYTVTDIEYISGTYINADGTDEFMNDNDTVTVGLPYAPAMPELGSFAPASITYNSASASFTLSDRALADAVGGWIGVAVFDGYNIVKNVAATVGNNSIEVSGLTEDSQYRVYVYLYGDIHDGNGVCAHTIYDHSFMTKSVIDNDTYTAEGVIAYDDERDRYLGQINLNVSLISPTAEFIKVEVYDDSYDSPTLITSLDSFNGTAKISDGILNGYSYNVKIYYKDKEYPSGRCRETGVWVGSLGTVYNYDGGYYPIYNDLVYHVTLGNNDENYAHVHDFTMYVYNKHSSNYIADLVLDYIANPNIVTDLEALADEKWELMYQANISGNYADGSKHLDEYNALNDRVEDYRDALYALENYYNNNTDTAFWEAESAKGRYAYTVSYNGEDTAEVIRVGKTYYFILDDFYTIPDWEDCEYNIIAHIDSNDGKGLAEREFYGAFYHSNSFITFNGLLTNDLAITDGKISYTFFNRDCYDNNGEYFTADLGYVWKIVATRGYVYSEDYKEVTLYEIAEEPTYGTNGDEWLAAYLGAVRAGEDVSGLLLQYVGAYEPSYSIDVDLSRLSQYGRWDIHVYTRLHMGSYTEDEPYDYENNTSYHKTVKIKAPTLSFEGRNAVVAFPDENYYIVYYNVKDASGDLIAENQIGDSVYYMEQVGYQIQARLESYEEGLTPSDWSEWVTFTGEKITLDFNDYDRDTCSVSWYASLEVEKWSYTINGGPVLDLPANITSLVLSDGDVLRLKAVAVADSEHVDSDWAEFVCTDARPSVAIPTGLTVSSKGGFATLEWTVSSTDNISGYRVYVNGVCMEDIWVESFGTSCSCSVPKMTSSDSYRIQAVSSDADNYRSSLSVIVSE